MVTYNIMNKTAYAKKDLMKIIMVETTAVLQRCIFWKQV